MDRQKNSLKRWIKGNPPGLGKTIIMGLLCETWEIIIVTYADE